VQLETPDARGHLSIVSLNIFFCESNYTAAIWNAGCALIPVIPIGLLMMIKQQVIDKLFFKCLNFYQNNGVHLTGVLSLSDERHIFLFSPEFGIIPD
jgi:hypothetical protein